MGPPEFLRHKNVLIFLNQALLSGLRGSRGLREYATPPLAINGERDNHFNKKDKTEAGECTEFMRNSTVVICAVTDLL